MDWRDIYELIFNCIFGIVSSVVISRIFLIYQDLRDEYNSVTQGMSVLGDIQTNIRFYKNPGFLRLCTSRKEEDSDDEVKKNALMAINKISFGELERIEAMKHLVSREIRIIADIYATNLLFISQCSDLRKKDLSCDRIEAVEECLSKLKEISESFLSYRKNMVNLTLLKAIKDRLIIIMMVILLIAIFIPVICMVL